MDSLIFVTKPNEVDTQEPSVSAWVICLIVVLILLLIIIAGGKQARKSQRPTSLEIPLNNS